MTGIVTFVRMEWIEHVARMGEMDENAHNVFVEKSEIKMALVRCKVKLSP
jgi:hypothetical protein